MRFIHTDSQPACVMWTLCWFPVFVCAQRLNHNTLEKQRRAKMRQLFDVLRKEVGQSEDKMSKISTLKKVPLLFLSSLHSFTNQLLSFYLWRRHEIKWVRVRAGGAGDPAADDDWDWSEENEEETEEEERRLPQLHRSNRSELCSTITWELKNISLFKTSIELTSHYWTQTNAARRVDWSWSPVIPLPVYLQDFVSSFLFILLSVPVC